MSRENVERVRAIMPPDGTDLVELRGGLAFGGGGLVAEDAPVRFVGQSGGELSGRGPEGASATWAEWLEPWESYRVFWEGFLDQDDRVVLLSRLRGVTKHDSVEIEQEAAAVFRFDGGRVVEILFTLDRDAVSRE